MISRGEIHPNGFLTHFLSDGIYLRVLHIPKGTVIIGRKHLTDHLSILLKGSIEVTINGEKRLMKAPYIFEAKANSVKIGMTITDCEFANIHPTDITSLAPEEVDKIVNKVTAEPENKKEIYNQVRGMLK